MPVASRADARTLLPRSPIAAMNTEMKVAGTSPPYWPKTTKASTPPSTQSQPRHSVGMLLAVPKSPGSAVIQIATPTSASRMPSTTGTKPAPMCVSEPIRYSSPWPTMARPRTSRTTPLTRSLLYWRIGFMRSPGWAGSPRRMLWPRPAHGYRAFTESRVHVFGVGGPWSRCRRRDPGEEFRGTVRHQVALLVDRHHVIAVVEQHL